MLSKILLTSYKIDVSTGGKLSYIRIQLFPVIREIYQLPSVENYSVFFTSISYQT
ncbi:hypothetical protein LCGC14_0610660 [marine sediment metagenome]|uniref:Uncharacterized protein n=1 Tax=marine sediment metagenome TaxID=412755 RepID=A0A0F9TTZ9_9ZZZZ